MTTTVSILIAFGVYLLGMIGIGIWSMRQTKGADDFFLGGRGLSAPVAAMSAQASDMSGWLLMGLPGSVYALGTGQAWIAVGLGLGTIANWLIIARPLRAYTIVAGNSMTLPEFFGNRYHDEKKILLGISSVIIVIFFLVYTASALASGGKLFNTVFGLDYHIALFLGAAVILIYTFMGGFLAVCSTDFFQGLLMMLALMLVPLVVCIGHSDLLDPTALTTVYEYTDAATGAVTQCAFGGGIFDASWQDIVSGLGWGLGYFGMPHILVRFMSIEKPSMIKKSSIVAIVWVIISLFSAVLIAYFGRMVMGAELLTQGNQKLVFIAMARKFFPAGICGLLLAAIIAASISTADSQLLVASSSFTADLYKPFFRKNASEKETLMVGRILVLILSLIAFGIANSKGSGAQAIMDMVENAWGAFGASFGPTILLSLFWKRFNYQGAVAGVISGFVVDLGWLLTGMTDATGIFEIIPGFFASLLIAVVVANLTAEPNEKAVEIFEQGIKAETE